MKTTASLSYLRFSERNLVKKAEGTENKITLKGSDTFL